MSAPVRFADVDGASVHVPSTWRKTASRRLDNVRCQTDPVGVSDAESQAVRRHDAAAQATGPEHGDGERHEGKVAEEEDRETPRSDLSGSERVDASFENWTIDDPELESFLAATGNFMLDELARSAQSSAFDLLAPVTSAEMDSEQAAVLYELARPTGSLEEQDQLSCTAVAWNATGSQLLVSFGRLDNYGWCTHRGSVCVWSVFARGARRGQLERETPPDFRLEASSGVMCVAGHPEQPALIAAGTFNGEVLLFDTTRADTGEDTLVAASQIEDYCHREPVLGLEWVPDPRVASLGSAGGGAANARGAGYLLASVSSDGRVLLWDASSDLSAPLKGLSLAAKTTRGAKPLGGTALSFCRAKGSTATNFVVGSEGGALVRCTLAGVSTSAPATARELALAPGAEKWSAQALGLLALVPEKERVVLRHSVDKYAAAESIALVQPRHIYEASRADNFMFPNVVRFTYESHVGPVHAVQCAPFHRNAFLSCGADGNVRLYSLLEKRPALVVAPTKASHYMHCAAWSPHRPAVFACSSSNGELFVFDLSVDSASPVVSLPAGGAKGCAVHSLAFNAKTRGLVATGDQSGEVRIFKLGWRLANRQGVDKAALDYALHSGTRV